MTAYAGRLSGEGLRVAVITSRFNDLVTARLLDVGLDGLGLDPLAEPDLPCLDLLLADGELLLRARERLVFVAAA